MVSEWKVTSRSLKTHQERHGNPPKLVVLLGVFVHPLKMSICLRFILSFQGILMDSTPTLW